MYLHELLVHVKTREEQLIFWAGKRLCYPKMAEVAKAVLFIPASSATSDRAFSDAGFTLNIGRTTMNPTNVDKGIFLRSYIENPVYCGLSGNHEDSEDEISE